MKLRLLLALAILTVTSCVSTNDAGQTWLAWRYQKLKMEL